MSPLNSDLLNPHLIQLFSILLERKIVSQIFNTLLAWKVGLD